MVVQSNFKNKDQKLYFNPILYDYNPWPRESIVASGIIFKDGYCHINSYRFQPLKKVFWKLYIKDGDELTVWATDIGLIDVPGYADEINGVKRPSGVREPWCVSHPLKG